MKRGVLVLLVVGLLSGCVNYRASRVTAKVGAGVALVGVVLAGMALIDGGPNAGFAVFGISAVVIAPGAVLGLGGLLGMAAHGDPAEANEPVERVAQPAPRVSPDCLRERGARLKRAHAIADRDQRAKALVAVPVCQPVLSSD